MWVDEVRLIKRQFDIRVDNAQVKPLIGVSNDEVLKNYEAVYLDGNTSATQTHWTGDSFSVTAKNKAPLRMVGLEAQAGDDWIRIATIDGKSSSVVVELNENTINYLDSKGAISWSTNGSCDHGGSFYKGSITVRPVFDYIDVEVEVQADENGYGTLCLPEPIIDPAEPLLLWDFGANNNMHGVMVLFFN